MKLIEKLEDSNEPLLIDNILPKNSNLHILNLLSKQNWQIASDSNDKFSSGYDENFKHMGWMYCSYGDGNCQNFYDSPLNVFGFIIADIVCNSLNTNCKNIKRFIWNYYNTNQEGTNHTDEKEKNHISIIYNLHTTDGGTVINNKFYGDKESQAKVFRSNWMHKGVGPKSNKARSNLNIVIEI